VVSIRRQRSDESSERREEIVPHCPSPCNGSCGTCRCGKSMCNCTCSFETLGDHQRNPHPPDGEDDE